VARRPCEARAFISPARLAGGRWRRHNVGAGERVSRLDQPRAAGAAGGRAEAQAGGVRGATPRRHTPLHARRPRAHCRRAAGGRTQLLPADRAAQVGRRAVGIAVRATAAAV
jgi:hypothetical protein